MPDPPGRTAYAVFRRRARVSQTRFAAEKEASWRRNGTDMRPGIGPGSCSSGCSGKIRLISAHFRHTDMLICVAPILPHHFRHINLGVAGSAQRDGGAMGPWERTRRYLAELDGKLGGKKAVSCTIGPDRLAGPGVTQARPAGTVASAQRHSPQRRRTAATAHRPSHLPAMQSRRVARHSPRLGRRGPGPCRA